MKTPMRMLVSNISRPRRDLRLSGNRSPELRLLRLVTLARDGRLRTSCGLNADRRKPGLLDLPALMLPALLFLSAVIYTAWSSWWIR